MKIYRVDEGGLLIPQENVTVMLLERVIVRVSEAETTALRIRMHKERLLTEYHCGVQADHPFHNSLERHTVSAENVYKPKHSGGCSQKMTFSGRLHHPHLCLLPLEP